MGHAARKTVHMDCASTPNCRWEPPGCGLSWNWRAEDETDRIQRNEQMLDGASAAKLEGLIREKWWTCTFYLCNTAFESCLTVDKNSLQNARQKASADNTRYRKQFRRPGHFSSPIRGKGGGTFAPRPMVHSEHGEIINSR